MVLILSYIMRMRYSSLLYQRIVMVAVALAMTLVLFVKGRQSRVDPGLTALSVVPEQTFVLQISGDVLHPGIYRINDNKMTAGVIEMARPFCDVLPALPEYRLSTSLHAANELKILCKGPQNKPVIKLDIIKPCQCLTLGVPLDINQMTERDFEMLPGIGPVLANRIVFWRQQNGGFASLHDLLQVEGIGEAKFKQISAYVNLPIQQKK